MNYMITGNAGLIGQFLKKELDKENNCIMHIDQREGFNINSLNGIKLNPITQKVDIFFHLAAHCKINESISSPEITYINNVLGAFSVLEFCRKNNIKKIMAFSSSRVLSKEENPYTASKKYLENLCKAYYECYGIEYIIIRPSTVYGPIHDVTSRLLTNWVINSLTDKELIIYGDKDKTLSFTHVEDFVKGCMILLKKWEMTKNDSYNIAGDEVKLVDVANYILSKGKGQLVFKEPETAQPQQVKVDSSKIKSFGWEPKIELFKGIDELINFYKTEGIKWL